VTVDAGGDVFRDKQCLNEISLQVFQPDGKRRVIVRRAFVKFQTQSRALSIDVGMYDRYAALFSRTEPANNRIAPAQPAPQ
jgi:acyl CoA:acetate/3-ketoacid CoA transferase